MTTDSKGACSSCRKPAAKMTRTWCRACYLRWLKAGRPDDGPPPLKNDSLERWRETPILAIDREPSDLDAGTAGEHLVCADLLLSGFTAFRADQNCAYDVAVDLGGRLIRLQVKSTRDPRPVPQRKTPASAYLWHVRRSGKGGRRTYASNAFDLLALVALDIRQVAYVPPSANRMTMQIQKPDSGSGKQFSDYPFGRALHEIGAVR